MFIHLNIRSLTAHFEEFEVILKMLGYLQIIGQPESGLKAEYEHLFRIPNYHFVPVSRDHRSGEGEG